MKMPTIPCPHCGTMFYAKPERIARSQSVHCSHECRRQARGMPDAPNPSGLCQCGCGETAPLATQTERRHGWVKDQPMRFCLGHNNRRREIKPVRYVEEDRGHKTPCWIWQLKTGIPGYGIWKINRVQHLAHRVYYQRLVGPIPDGLVLDHLCRVPACVNPDHLEPVTIEENLWRGNSRKLTAEQVRAIMSADGVPLRVLADRYGISHNYACGIRTGSRIPKFATVER